MSIIALLVLPTLSGCGLLMGDLRRDLDDRDPFSSATFGGRFYERGTLLDDEEETSSAGLEEARLGRVGHTERRPAAGLYRLDEDEGGGSEFGRPAGRGAAFAEDDNRPPESRRAYKPRRATRDDFIDRDENEGSLWASDGQTNYYFTKNKVRGVGDLVNITVEDLFFKDITRELGRTLSQQEREEELALAQERIRRRALGLPEGTDRVTTTSASALPANAGGEGGAESTRVEMRDATDADIDVGPSIELKKGDIVMAEIIERYPNGNYKIRGTKRIPYRTGYRFLTVTAIARGVDIPEDDTIASGKLYEYRMEVVR